MEGLTNKETNFPDWLPHDVKKCLLPRLSNRSSVREIQKRLLTDDRMEKVWKSICKEKNKKKRQDNLEVFFSDAPEALILGKILQVAHANKENIEVLIDCQKALTKVKRYLLPLHRLNVPDKVKLPLNEAINKFEHWIQKKKSDLNFEKEDVSWMSLSLGLKSAPLEALKKKGAKNFDETYAFLALAILFNEFFQKNHMSMIVDTVMVMKNISKDKREVFRLRVKFIVKNHFPKKSMT